jgi:DNA-binding CsgD family transcriptional regulator
MIYPAPMVGATQLLERDGEIAAIGDALDGLEEDGGRTILVEGPPGIGKSALIAASRELAAERGIRVLTARGSELEVEFPFGVVRQLFEAELIDPERRGTLLADAAAPAAAVFDSLGGHEEGEEAPGTFAALHGLMWLAFNAAAGDPLLIVIDDLHWCDRPSLRFAAYLSHRLEGTRIGLLLGLRNTEPGTDAELIGTILAESGILSIRPGTLSDEAVGEFVEDRLDGGSDSEFGLACARATGGNPLLLRQLLSAIESEGGRGTSSGAQLVHQVGGKAVSRSVRTRLAKLGDEATRVAYAIAVLGDGADVATVARVTELSEDRVAAATGALASAEILEASLPLGFVHPLVHHAVYGELAPGERELQHDRAARILRDAGAPVERVAAHLLASPPRGEPWVADLLDAAAQAASDKGAAETVVRYRERTLEEPLDPERRLRTIFELGIAETDTDGDAAAAHLREVFDSSADPEMGMQAATVLIRTLMFLGRSEEAQELLETVRSRLPPDADEVRRMLDSLAVIGVVFTGVQHEPDEQLESFRHQEHPDTLGGRMLAAATAFDWAATGGEREQCVALAQSAVADEELMNFDNGLLWVSATTVLVFAETGDPDGAWERGLRTAHRRGSLFTALSVHLWQGWTMRYHGQLAEAETSIMQSLEELRLWAKIDRLLDYPIGFLVETYVDIGALDLARDMLGDVNRSDDPADGAAIRRRATVELMLAEGAGEQAVDAAEDYARKLTRTTSPTWHPWRSLLARAFHAAGRSEEGIPLLDEELELARRWGAPGPIGRALRIRGQLRGKDGLGDLEQAAEVLSDSRMRLEHARALAALGGALRRERRPSESREPLMRALEIAESCGARSLVADVRTELRASGVRARSTALQGVESLTASERRVAELAAEGMTNKEIAQALFVTPKTVEVHLSNSYRKLDISGRRQLPGALAGTS